MMNKNNFPIQHNTIVLAREHGRWFPIVFDELTATGFRCYSHFAWGNQINPDYIFPHEIAPLKGNEKMIHKDGDCFEIWDAERVGKECEG